MYDMYQENILEHYRKPRNFGSLAKPDMEAEDYNPLCGDKIGMGIKIKDGKIEEIMFSGEGCAISQASASMLTEAVKGKPAEEAARFSKEDMLGLLGIPVSASRLKCALLGLKVFKLVLYGFMGKSLSGNEYLG
ncbi:MAG: SUF system NifU family Fe-S cluster assembly protein [Candidatus Ryanbacteria bacterium RIFCSPHIGHO2_01_FULL_45_22]|uniref:SUF system NifU family Fe-S cluster assembly protein n=1 Tax=Candidatus Ryanbacteria bacterium RIFCSPHIGHO2_01_FULL_45_22 TaxID=1802114 RepID=A0A1G2FZX5_9BACT|nr:MAG: SUF system NifU family Fe-S cluster assembly protein [Candidatus Ryanbacteria bacterium RIFCSPHIGHO2_01_FULL_45_22]